MSRWGLPTTIEISGVDYPIRTDFRDILTIIQALTDPDLNDQEKAIVLISILYLERPEDLETAIKKGMDFIAAGTEDDGKKRPVMMDWEQDYDIIIPAVNKVAGREVRGVEYLHWWTFVGYYMEIGESLFTQVLNIRQKRAKGKKLEKWEREFEKDNLKIVRLHKKLTEEEQAQREAELQALKDLVG